jgi:hypothetical protein
VGFQGCLPGLRGEGKQLKARSPCDRQAGRKRPWSPQDARSGRQQLPERGGAGPSRRPRLPSCLRLQCTGTPRCRGARAYVRAFTLPWAPRLGKSQGRQGPLCQGSKMPGSQPSPLPNPFRKPFKPRFNLDALACPAPSLPRPRPPPVLLPSPPPRRGPSLAWFRRICWRVGDTRSHPPPAPSRRPPRATALGELHSHKCCLQLIAWAGEGKGPGRRPRPEAGAPLLGSCVRFAAACTSTTPACKFEM